MTRSRRAGSPAAVERIVGVALAAFGCGAGHRRVTVGAVERVRGQFIGKIRVALEKPGWQADWRRERNYLLAYAEAMGRRAAQLATEERRRFITHEDVSLATEKLRGYMPIAGRWCPL